MNYSGKNKYLKQKNTLQNFLFWSILLFFIGFNILLGSGIGLLLAFQDDLPSLAPLEDYTSEEWTLPTKVYSRSGEEIASFHKEQRQLVKISELPPELIKALIAVEDNRFFQHNGIDFWGIARAFVQNIKAGRIVEGGSTITQQLAKVLFLTPRQTFKRKLKEALMSVQIERTYTKREILERYFNKIYFGAGAYGVEAAARVYFDKSAKNINIAEAALLVGLPRAPSSYSPLRNPDRARQRHRIVLSMMAQRGIISQQKARKLHKEFWSEFDRTHYDQEDTKEENIKKAPYFVEHIRRQLLDRYGSEMVYRGGLQVHTTVDMNYQKILEDYMYDYLLELNIEQDNLPDTATKFSENNDSSIIEGSAVIRDPKNGQIMALVGGHRWDGKNQLNRAVQAQRQPGSAFKPVLYAAALENGYTPTSKLQDRPLIYNTPQGQWTPRNYSQRFHGEVTIREALLDSLNVATVYLLEQVGTRELLEMARKLGIDQSLGSHMSIALGGLNRGLSVVELSDVYTVFANQGMLNDPIYIREVRDREGNLLERNFPHNREVLNPQIAYIMTHLLQGVVDEGTGQRLGREFDIPLAGKTGTSNRYRDAWFMGFTPDLVFGSWFGYDSSNQSLGQHMSGGVVAGEFWRQAGQEIFANHSYETFSVPEGINFLNICTDSGYLATNECSNTRQIPFVSGTEPTRSCPQHGR
ncbi:MAG: penicillin-binding protein 1A [bacterium]